ncbi:MAG: DUF2061 domain-containing protein [Pelagibacteraceae bacterium]|jgi:uncharacterized membrane protein|nr:DUF2061 domain-containing protein [Pelagibacteraceae bacterium]MCI5079246.1 DUF2061 domain-containing protein [Pelagibacteraceae bacterium]
MITESRKRSLFKTISWRVLASIDTFLISWLISGKISIGISIATLEVVTKLIIYYFHERAWDKIKWGKYDK